MSCGNKCIILEIIKDKITYNKTALGKLLLILLCILFSTYSYPNMLEINYNYSFNIIDYIFGREVGGIASTSIILILISFIILSFWAVYKRSIPIVSFIIYIIGSLLLLTIVKN